MLILSILLMGITGGVLPYLPVYRTLDAQVIMMTIQIVMMMRRRMALVMIMMMMDVVVRLAWLALIAVALATFLGRR